MDRSSAEGVQSDKAHEAFVLARLESTLPLSDQWDAFVAGLPKINKKEYAGHARAMKAELEEKKATLATEFFDQHCDKALAVSAAWTDEFIGPRVPARVREAQAWLAEARRAVAVAADQAKESLSEQECAVWAASYQEVD